MNNSPRPHLFHTKKAPRLGAAGPGCARGRLCWTRSPRRNGDRLIRLPYFRLDETSLKVFWSFEPRRVIEAMIATATSEAIRAYSMAVAPDSLATNILRDLIIVFAPAGKCLR